jgi:hypothetical protein
VVREPLLRLPWPLPALLVWGASWSVFLAGQRWLQLPQVMALLPAAAVAIACSLRQGTRWRKIFIAWGFPLSLAASGLIGQVPAWTWLLPLAMLAVVYPVRTWTDAPLFPTPAGALRGLAQLVPLPPGARIVDAGCGLGDGLRELQREYPQAHLAGIEWGWPLFVASCLRARFAQVRRGDLWRDDWWPMSWSTCSSGRRAWGARPRRQGASSAPGPGWPAWNFRCRARGRPGRWRARTVGPCGCTGRRFGPGEGGSGFSPRRAPHRQPLHQQGSSRSLRIASHFGAWSSRCSSFIPQNPKRPGRWV